MGDYEVAVDMSGDWKYISVVVFFGRPRRSFRPHVASLNKKARIKVIKELIDASSRGEIYAVCICAEAKIKARQMYKITRNKYSAWKRVISQELNKASQHLRSKGFWPILRVHADNEFRPFETILQRVFKTNNTIVEKNDHVAFAGIVAYINLKHRSFSNQQRVL